MPTSASRYNDTDGCPYWTKDADWAFTRAEIETIEAASLELHHLYLDEGAA